MLESFSATEKSSLMVVLWILFLPSTIKNCLGISKKSYCMTWKSVVSQQYYAYSEFSELEDDRYLVLVPNTVTTLAALSTT